MVVFLFFLAPFVFSTGQRENRLRDATALIAAEQSGSGGLGLPFETVRDTIASFELQELLQFPLEYSSVQLLELVGLLIDQEEYNMAAVLLSGIVVEDEEQLYVAEQYFDIIREANTQYVAKGEEVQAKLTELLSEEIADEDLVSTAIEALALINEMEEIVPNPNPRDAVIIDDLRYTVQLNIDRRRFEALMDAAAARLADEDYSGAVEIYVNGVVEVVEDTQSADGTNEAGITLENGLDIQRRFFEGRSYGILGDQVVSARESLRTLGAEFVTVGPAALARSAELADAFASGDSSDAQASVDEYLDVLSDVTGYVDSVELATATFVDAEEIASRQALEDEESRLDWHLVFLRTMVQGRDTAAAPEGFLYAVDRVREIVETGPVNAARQFGVASYEEAVSLLETIAWPLEASSFGGISAVGSTIDRAERLLQEAGTSLNTYTDILSVSRSLDLVSVAPPSQIGSISAVGSGEQWSRYLASVGELISDTDVVEDVPLRETLVESTSIGAAAGYLRLVGSRALDGLDAADARRTTITSLESQREGVREILGTLTEPASGTLRALLNEWETFSESALSGREIGGQATGALQYNRDFLEARITEVEGYERAIVENIARLEYNGLNGRLSSLQSRTDDAQESLDGITETVTARDDTGQVIRDEDGQLVRFQAVRNYPDRARETLVPMVGQTSGTRILSTALGDLQRTLDDSRNYVERYTGEEPYITRSVSLQEDIARASRIVETIGESDGQALFRRARDLLQTAINEIATAVDLENQGDQRVATIRDLIEEAFAASDAEDLERAGETLAQAEALLKSDSARVRDASDLYSESLATWYRSDLEERWNETQKQLNDDIALAQADIVITRVQQDVREAQPLVDDQQWSSALSILQAADELWSNVFPQTVYPPLVRLLRFVETALAKQNERVLREDDPDFDKLAPVLSRATQALAQGLIDNATSLLEQFLRAQPNNLEARLLEVDIALASAGGDIATKIDRLISGSLPEGTTRTQIGGLNAAEALELQSLLIAIEERISDREDVGVALLDQIAGEIATLEDILSPPPVVVVTPDLRAESNALVDQALASGNLETLSVAQLANSLSLLENALEIDPANERAIELLGTALRLPGAPRREALDATEQQVVSQARDLFARGENFEALQLINQLWADPNNRNDTELTRFREELLDAIRRSQ